MVDHDKYASIKNVFRRNPDTGKVIYGNFSLSEFEYLQDCKWNWTEKIDGMNVRVILDEGADFRGRSDAATMPRRLTKHLEDTFELEDILTESCEYGKALCLYGEGAGAGIQSGAKYSPEQFFILFDVTTNYGWASRRDVVDIAEHLHIPIVPLVLKGTVKEAVNVVECGLKSSFGDFFAEGLVGRPFPELLNRYGDRIIAKVKHCDFYKDLT